MSSIELSDIGPLERLSIPLRPGFNVLHGRNDSGKSVTIEAVATLAGGGNGKVTCRDGAARGSIEGFGVRITAGRSTRRTGELEVSSLESKLPVAELVDPKIKDPAAADGKRIKALLSLTGATADPARFYELAGGKEVFDSLCPPETIQTDDLVDMASRVKRAFESTARKTEDAAQTEEGKAIADRGAGDGLDLEANTDSASLQEALESAISKHSRLQERYDSAEDAKADAEVARKKLAEVGSSGESKQSALEALELAKENRDVAVTDAREAKAAVDRLEAEMKAAKAQLGSALVAQQASDGAVASAEKAVNAVEDNARLYAGWQAAIDAAANVSAPEAVEILRASQAVTTARKALEQAAVVRAAKDRIAKAKKHQEEAAKLRKRADRLREAAKQTDDVLSASVDSKHLKVKSGRLVTIKPDGREAFYGDRSQGTRWLIALDEATARIRALHADGEAVIAAPQEAFESLDVANRRLIHEHACKLGVAILTAEAVGQEVEVVPYDPEEDWKAKAEFATAAAE